MTANRVLAAGLGALTGLAVLAAVVSSLRLGWSWAELFDAFVVTNAVMGIAFGACGVILAWHRPRNAIGWLFAAGGLLQAVSASMPPVQTLVKQSAADPVLLRLLATAFVYSWPWAIGLCIPLALLLFPDGRPVSRAWRPVLVAVVVTAPLFVLEMGAAPEPMGDGGPLAYLTLPFYDRLGPVWQFAEIRTSAVYVLALAALAVRYRRGDEATRRQLLWLLLALSLVIVALLVWGLVANAPVAVLLAVPLIPVAVTVAIVRYRLLDIRLVVSRAVAWLLLSLAVIVAYAVLVAGLDRLISSQLGRSATATVLLVLLAAPVLPRLQRIVDRAMYGDRANPARVVSQLGAQLAQPVGDQGPEAGLIRVAASIRQALRLPYVAVERDGEVLAADGLRPEPVAATLLTYGGDEVGTLAIGLRDGEVRLAEPDRRALELLAAPLAVAVHATVVSTELQASRERLIGAREEERRRLRRELHDGLGPALTGIAFTADAAANLVDDPDQVAGLLDTLRRDTRAALADVRRVVEDLRPPALDELGLVGALQQRAEQLSWRADGAAVQVRLDVPPEVPALPAAVEVAAYRIATEALTNVARHSRASSAVVRLRCGDRLEVSVSDDGPTSGSWSPGVGLQTMQERAAELGGAFAAGPSPAGGQVRAWFPLAAR
jgi:two-component system NarL family sensor kinase